MRHMPLRTSWMLVALLAVTLLFLLAPGMAWAQQICGVAAEGDPGDPGEEGFQVDGQFFSGPDADDWARGASYNWVILDDGTPNPAFVPAGLYERDPHWAGGAVDPTTFDGGSNKNNDDISPMGDPWTVTTGSGPQKNDLTDLYANARVFDSGGDHVWIILGAMTRAANGDSHVDFEWNLAGLEEVEDVPLYERAADSYIVGLGPHAGRTAGTDFIISADFTGGGSVVETHVRQWQYVTDHYEYVDVTSSLPAGSYFVCADDSDLGAPVPYWGAVAPDGSEVAYGGNATPLQFVEIAVDLAAFGIHPWDLCTSESTIMFKTRSSQEFTAELKDFGLYPFPIVSTPRCVLNGPDPMCEDDWPGYAELCGPETPNGLDYKYVWFGPAWADSFVTTSPDSCVTVSDIADTGLYSLIVRDLTSGCAAGPCDYRLIVFPEPECDISGTPELCVLEPYQDVGYSIGCPGFEIDQYTWSITSGNAQIVGGQGTPNVTVRVYDQSFTLQCYIVDFHGDVTCDGTFTYPVIVHPNPDCEIMGEFALCLDDFGASQDYSLGNCPDFVIVNDSCDWTLVGTNTAGAMITDDTDCVATVTVAQAGEFTLHVEYVDENDCPGVAEQTVVVYPEPDCDLDGVTEICLDDATDLEYSLINCDDFDIVDCDYSFTANTAGATLDDVTDCVATVSASQDGYFTLHVEYVDDNGCDGTADLTVTIDPEPECEITGTTAICLDYATDLIYQIGDCPGFVVDPTTCNWWLTDNTAGASIDDVTDCVATVSASQEGSFVIHVSYEDENGCDGEDSHTVTIYPEPDCEIQGETEICLDDAGALMYSLGNCPGVEIDPTTCNWWLTNNTAGASIDDVTDCVATVSASQAGSFTIHVTYADVNDCDGEDDLVVTIYPEPECEITGPTAVCLDDADALMYEIGDCPGFVVDLTTCNWWLTDNTAGASIDDVTDCVATVSASQDGSFIIHVSYEDENGCDGEDSHTVTIYPEPDCEIQGETEICLDDAGALEYSLGNCPDFVIDPTTCGWWLTDNTAGAMIDDMTDCVATVSASQAGSFIIHVTYEDENGCDGEDQLTVTIYPEPECEITGPTAVCLDDADALMYEIGDCPGFVVDLTTCNWWLTANTAGATIDDVTDCVATVSASQAGSFTVHVSYEDENGCDGEDSHTVTIYPEPDCSIDGETEVCLDDAGALMYSLADCPDFVINTESCNWWLTDNTAGASIDDVTDCVATVSASQDGSFIIHVSYEDENGCDGETQLTVTIYPEPDCEIQGIDEICFIDLDTLEYSLGNCPDFVIDPTTCNWWLTDNTAGATIDDVTDCVATVSASQDGDFTIHVSYEDENGCDGEDSYTVTIYPQPPCMIDAPDDVCFGDLPIEICGPEPPAPGAYRYEWSIGVPTVGGKGPSDISSSLEDENRVEEHCYEFDPPVPGDYLVSLTVFDLQSDLECWTQCDTNIRVGDAPTCFIDTLDQRPECGSEENELAADITPPDVTPDYMSYQWKLVEGADCGWEITDGADTDTVIFTAGDGEDCCGLFRLIVTAHYGDVACADSCEVEQCCRPIYDEFCSFTKGYYGNAGGYKFGGMTTAEIIQAAIPTSDPLVLGVLGVRSLTIPDTSALCIIDRLPGGGPSGPLPDFGDEVLLASTCLASIDPGEDQLPLQHNGQFRNNFLTQVIALSLNTRLWWVHPDIAGHLGDAPICPYMQTLGAMCGDDGICGSVDDVAVLEDCKNFGIDMAVLEAIDTEFGGGNRDVEHLLMLANRALAELSTGGATLGQIHDAVTAINEGFDECRFLNHCGDDPADCPEFIPKGAMIVLPDGDGSLSKPIVPDAFALSPNAPNPVKTGTSIKYALPEESQVRLTIYNVKGQVVDTLEDGVKPAGYHTAYWHSGSRSEVSAGVYFLRMQAVGNETGETFSMTQKMVVVR